MIEDRSFFSYDLHTHTCASDGLLTPTALVQRATVMGVNVLAISDHDTVKGIEEAREAIVKHQLALQLIAGVEVSTLWQHHEIHLVGLGIGINHPLLIALLQTQRDHRITRARQIARQLEKAGITGAWEAASCMAEDGVVTRAHFARYLIEQGKGSTMAQIFKRYLAQGKTGYVPVQWVAMEQAIKTIHYAGGLAVLAHPCRYGLSMKWLKRLIACFAEAQGDALEVAQCQQSLHQRQQLARLARDHRLLASQGSDFHYPCPWIELGRNLWLPAGIDSIWESNSDIF